MASSLPVRLTRRLSRFGLGRLTRTRPARIGFPGGIVSFTFDDFPKSAFSVGRAILRHHGAFGTYYASLGLAGTHGTLGPMFDPEDIRALHAEGHEIGCHTFRHVNCSRTAVATILADVADNAAQFAALLDGYGPANFAYPFGELSLTAKRALAPLFTTCRGIGQGFNAGIADLADLRGSHIHDRGFDLARFRSLIDRNREIGGWLIFYTHDVADAASPYGCTPAQFDAVVAYAARQGPVLPVRDAAARLGLPTRGAATYPHHGSSP